MSEKFDGADGDFPGHLLHQAALWDNSDLLLDLLRGELRLQIESQDSWGRTALHAAATTQDSNCLGPLLSAGANPNAVSGGQDNFKTPLHTSAEHGFLSNVHALVRGGADIFRLEGRALTAADLAQRGGHVETYKYLINVTKEQEEARENLHSLIREAVGHGDVEGLKKILGKQSLGADKRELLNKTPHGSNTLLFKASESGNAELVKILIEHGADGRIHPVTKYSPLYIAAYHGHRHIVNLLLTKFPGLVQVPTVEKWLPLHAACINGHVSVLETLLNYKYPIELLSNYPAKTIWNGTSIGAGDSTSTSTGAPASDSNSGEIPEVQMGFDLNAKDVSGQTALYISCQMGNPRLVEVLIKFKLPIIKKGEAQEVEAEKDKPSSPTKRRLSSGIQGILSKLSIASKNQSLLFPALTRAQKLGSPLDVNIYCEDYQTALHVAVKARNHVIAHHLLGGGGRADPNLPIRVRPPQAQHWDTNCGTSGSNSGGESETSTALVEACKLRDLGMIDLLLKHGARDEESKALFSCVSARDDIIVGKLLALRAHGDSENTVNSAALRAGMSGAAEKKPLLITSIFPTTAVTIDWHAKRLDKITEGWLTGAALKLNPRLRLCPRTQNAICLHAITRLDLSSNSLTTVPPVIFTLSSLVYLNLSQNKISNLIFEPSNAAPLLRDFLLQENRLEWCPAELFTEFPNLITLNLSNNKLTALPAAMWLAPNLQELNVSLNLLSDLPLVSPQQQFMSLSMLVSTTFDSSMISKTSASNSDTDALLQHQGNWRKSLKIINEEDILHRDERTNPDSESALIFLNISHNLFTRVPIVLPCLATRLQRLNLAYNQLTELGNVSDYPGSLKLLDLSNNNIKSWFSSTYAKRPCYGLEPEPGMACTLHKLSRLENLRSLLLSGNQLSNIQLSTSDEPTGQIVFPNLTMFDISENKLITIPPRISELISLSVLNFSGNKELIELPPEIGLLSRIWNLNLQGCTNLGEPLKSLVDRKRSRTSDIIGYLRSVLEKSVPYTRMKLMLVGVHGIGKTTLLSLLRQEGSGGSGSSSSSSSGDRDNWAKRMGTSTSSSSSKGKNSGNLSTVGVDIGSLVLDPPKGSPKSAWPLGPVHFRTWDFGGQKEYYATHLYFLSKRSLYLVLWNITDGEKGLAEVQQWLVNIQCRAPNSTVILIGTHYDLVHEKFPPGYLAYLQGKIKDKFICIADPEKRGLPRTIASIEISCKSKYNVRALAGLIYETVVNLKTPNGKLLLEQRVPSKYLHLEEIVAYLATERKSQALDPVLTEDEFRSLASKWLNSGFNESFRDEAEISQACSFLHENGILLHFEDSTLRDSYFLDPQWLCDMLATVVTIREINPLAKNGLMTTSDLVHLFKNQSANTRQYVLSLLSKFELAIPWDESHLLIPSLLPSLGHTVQMQNEVKVRIPVRSRRLMRSSQSLGAIANVTSSDEKSKSIQCNPGPGPLPPLRRYVILSYFPSGFWPRLIIRLLGDDRIVDVIRNYFSNLPPPSELTPEIISVLDRQAEFSCYQTGIELTYGDLVILRVHQIEGQSQNSFLLRRDDLIYSESQSESISGPGSGAGADFEEVWDVVELESLGLLEMYLPSHSLSITNEDTEIDDDESPSLTSSTVLTPSIESLSKLLALVVDHVDTLLEDWFPNIGSRFVHTSEGKYLVTRLVPCPFCFPNFGSNSTRLNPENLEMEKQTGKNRGSCDSGMGNSPNTTVTAARLPSGSVDSITSSNSNCGSGDRPLSSEDVFSTAATARTRAGIFPVFETPKFGSVANNGLNFFLKSSSDTCAAGSRRSLYAWSIEHCILEAQGGVNIEAANTNAPVPEEIQPASVKCPKHGLIPVSSIAPDVLFLDLNSAFLIQSSAIERKKLIGRGAFGFVFAGTLKRENSIDLEDVAIKLFQPVDPGDDNPEAQHAWRIARAKYCRSPAQSSCRHYLAARGEVRVLYWLSHPNIVPFVGLSVAPLSILMPRAPHGALDNILGDFRRSGDKVSPETVQVTILQLAKALEYLHAHRIIYRDLKAENVLVWKFPEAFGPVGERRSVDVKLADYGISRTSFTTGSKGFAGTEGFMAPEIIRYNGEEEYTAKVDIFSFGMVLYEMLSLRQPFDGSENIKESILEGDRPSLSSRQVEAATLYALDLMISCWSHSSKDRPTAAQIIAIVSSPEFVAIRDVVGLSNIPNIVTSLTIGTYEVWISCSTGDLYSLSLAGRSSSRHQFISSKSIGFILDVITAMGCVGTKIWMGDTVSKIHIFEPDSEIGKIGEIELEPTLGLLGAVVSIQWISTAVTAVAFSSGRLFLLDSNSVEVVSELGKSTVIHSLASRFLDDGNAEIWSGEKGGKMRVFRFKDSKVTGLESISHYDCSNSTIDALQVLLISAHSNNELMFSYVFPGTVIYGWDAENREMISRLDVGKLLPGRSSSSELMGDELLVKPLQVTVLTTKENYVIVGTNWGYVFLASLGLSGISILQPFSADVRSILIFSGTKQRASSPTTTTGDESPISCESPTPSSSSTCGENLEDSDSTTKLILFGREFNHLIYSKIGAKIGTGSSGPRPTSTSSSSRKAFAILADLPL